MEISKAQQEVRTTFLGGSIGQLVSGTLWLISSALTRWHSQRYGILFLLIGGFFIFPITQLIIRLMGRPSSLSHENPFGQLAMQIAFTLPITLPIVGAATLYRPEWFYPAFMITLGAHYLPFTFLYGMRMFTPLCCILVFTGLSIGLYIPQAISLTGWFTGLVLLLFAFIGYRLVSKEQRHLT